jgi:hypothetical protein
MKTLKAAFLAFSVIGWLFVSSAANEPLRLLDGRVFYDWQVLSETATTVTIKHKGGGLKFEKRFLPEALLKVYPIDKEAVAKAAAAKEAIEKEALEKAQAKEDQDRAAVAQSAQAPTKSDPQPASVTRSETRQNTPRTMSTEVSTVLLPADANRAVHFVEYRLSGEALGLEVRTGENEQHNQTHDVNAMTGWSRSCQARTGDRLYFWAKEGSTGGETFRIQIYVDTLLVKEANARGINTEAELSYTLPSSGD